MSTNEQPETPPLTRKQLREIRNTGANPVIDTGALPVMTADDESATIEETDAAAVAPPPVEASLAPVSPLPRPAEPVVLPEPPGPDLGVDLGVSPLTRRQARQQERIRTASVPVITPDVAAAYEMQSASIPASDPVPPVLPPLVDSVPGAESDIESDIESDEDPFAVFGTDSGPTPVPEEADAEEDAAAAEGASSPEADASEKDGVAVEGSEESTEREEDEETPRIVDPGFGASLLAGETKPTESLPPSFDDLIAHSSSGSVSTPNALILSQSPAGGPIVAPVNATGEVLITGTFNLPEGLGSTGHAPGTADGKEVDAVLVDGELPAHSSPTPIAASSAISTSKAPGEIIKPPAPEKGGRLMLTLAITAGVLALALVGVLILAFATGVF